MAMAWGKDEVEAVKWYRKAADQNNFSAQYNLGFCYEKGEGVGKDEFEAVKWVSQSCRSKLRSGAMQPGPLL